MKRSRLLKSAYLVTIGFFSLWVVYDLYLQISSLTSAAESATPGQYISVFSSFLLLLGIIALAFAIANMQERQKILKLLLQKAGKPTNESGKVEYNLFRQMSLFDLATGTELARSNQNEDSLLSVNDFDFLTIETDETTDTDNDIDATSLIHHSLDPITEAKVLLKFGKNDAAISLLAESLAKTESRHDELTVALVGVLKQEIDNPRTPISRLEELYAKRKQIMRIVSRQRVHLSDEVWTRIQSIFPGHSSNKLNNPAIYLVEKRTGT